MSNNNPEYKENKFLDAALDLFMCFFGGIGFAYFCFCMTFGG